MLALPNFAQSITQATTTSKHFTNTAKPTKLAISLSCTVFSGTEGVQTYGGFTVQRIQPVVLTEYAFIVII